MIAVEKHKSERIWDIFWGQNQLFLIMCQIWGMRDLAPTFLSFAVRYIVILLTEIKEDE